VGDARWLMIWKKDRNGCWRDDGGPMTQDRGRGRCLIMRSAGRSDAGKDLEFILDIVGFVAVHLRLKEYSYDMIASSQLMMMMMR